MLSLRAAVAGVLQNPATPRLARIAASRRQARWSSEHKLARATVLGWTTDGCVESKLITETETKERREEEECVKRVARLMEDHHVKTAGIPPPIRSLPCLTNACVRTVLAELKEGKQIPLMDAMQILSAAALLLKDEPTVGEFDGKVVVVGDLHGSIGDMLHILETQGLPGEDAHYIFNGDLVDRGNNSCEVLLLALILKLSTPDAVHINRGNHEDGFLNARYGFYDECVAKYNLQFFDYACTVFSYLPLAAVINQRVFVCHGGLFDGSIAELKRLPRGPEYERYGPTRGLSKKYESMREDVLWSDPAEGVDVRKYSQRGIAHEFGKGFSHPWMRKNGIELVVRSHQCKSQSGLAQNHDGRVLTIFSASNYYWTMWGIRSGAYANDGSVLIFDAPEEGAERYMPKQYTWAPILLPVDDPHNSAVLYLTGEGFQYSVKAGRLKQAHLGNPKDWLMDAVLQRQSEFNALMREHDPQDTGLCDAWAFATAARQVARYIDYVFQADAEFYSSTDGLVNYKEMIAHYRERLRPSSDWHSEIVAAYVAHMQAQGVVLTEKDVASGKETMSRETLRQVVPVQFLSDDQLDSFLERSAQEAPQRELIKIVWAVDRRAERIARIRERLEENLVGEQELEDALVSAEEERGILSQRGVMEALDSLGAGATQCCARDLAEEVGRARSSLEEPGPQGCLATPQVQDVLMPAQRGAGAASEVVKALGLGQAFLMTVHRHRHELTSTSPCGRTGITVSTMKEALKQMNKVNNFPLSHTQIDMIIATMGDDGMITPERLSDALETPPP